MSFAAVQKHVAVLEGAGLVTKERTGRRKVVRTNHRKGCACTRRLLDEYEALYGRWSILPAMKPELITETKETDA